MPIVVWSPETRRHASTTEVWVGKPIAGDELPERVDVILAALRDARFPIREATTHDDRVLQRVHDAGLLQHLATVHEEWMCSEIPGLVGQDRVVPYVFATEAMLGGLPSHAATAVHARAGRYAYDTMTSVGPGTWEATAQAGRRQ